MPSVTGERAAVGTTCLVPDLYRAYPAGMGASYHQFCPVAKAMELLDERWTMLVIRELAAGSERFNELRQGLPRMSPTLLSKRLDQLVRAGVVEHIGAGPNGRYRLTAAGRELRPVVEALGVWGIRWIGELGDRDLDPKLLMWDMRRNVNHAAAPSTRTVVRFEFPDAVSSQRTWWLVITPDNADVCDEDPGHPVTLDVRVDLRTMTRIWRGDTSWPDAIRTASMTVTGPQHLRRALPSWLKLSGFAVVPRPAVSA
jgi:DNA-binding HxlR family transcriptional regulator